MAENEPISIQNMLMRNYSAGLVVKKFTTKLFRGLGTFSSFFFFNNTDLVKGCRLQEVSAILLLFHFGRILIGYNGM